MTYITAGELKQKREHERNELRELLLAADQERINELRRVMTLIKNTPPEDLQAVVNFVTTATDEQLAAALRITDRETRLQSIIDGLDANEVTRNRFNE